MILVDGHPQMHCAVDDRGLAYGDGVFRTLRARDGVPLRWNAHYAKLAADCAALALACPDSALLREEVAAVAGAGEAVVKIVVTRGSGPRGYGYDPALPGSRIVMSAPRPAHAEDPDSGIVARWCRLRLSRQPRLGGIKHLNRLENVLARAEWHDPAITEGLLCDDLGFVVGGVMSNVLWVQGRRLFTPSTCDSGVAGVTCARVLSSAAELGLQPQVGRWRPEALLAADELMVCNSIMGVRRVAQLDHQRWAPRGWTPIFNAALDEDRD